MRVRRSLKGVVIFKVSRDIDVVKIDFTLSGLKFSEHYSTQRYQKYFNVLDEILASIGIASQDYFSDYICYYGKSPILCRIYYDLETGRVRYVIMASIQSGVLSKLQQKFTEIGWKKVFFVEIMASTSTTRESYRY